jgi:transcription elongation factor SPT6
VQDDLDRLEAVETVEELKDVYQHFLLYHGRQLPASQEFHRKKVRSSLPSCQPRGY